MNVSHFVTNFAAPDNCEVPQKDEQYQPIYPLKRSKSDSGNIFQGSAEGM